MDELEHKLRSALTEMAEGVPPSHHAWAEQERRLALKSRRNRLRPALMAAVAAAVVALIAVPVVVLNSRSAPVDMGALPPDTKPSAVLTLPDGQKRVRYRSKDGETLSAEPMVVGSSQKTRTSQAAYVYTYTVRSPKGPMLCFATNVDGNEINGPEQGNYGDPTCTPIARPKSGYSWGMRDAPVTGNVGGTYVYVMSKPAEVLMLRDVNERLIVAQQRAVSDEFTVFVAYMDSKQQPKAWTVKDAADRVLQHGP